MHMASEACIAGALQRRFPAAAATSNSADDLNSQDLDVYQGLVVAIARRLLDVLYHIHTLQHTSKDGVLVVLQVGCRMLMHPMN